jgi:hypothetical protein
MFIATKHGAERMTAKRKKAKRFATSWWYSVNTYSYSPTNIVYSQIPETYRKTGPVGSEGRFGSPQNKFGEPNDG